MAIEKVDGLKEAPYVRWMIDGRGRIRSAARAFSWCFFLIRISKQPLKQLSKWKRIFLRQDAGRVALVCALPAKLEKLSCFRNSGLRGTIAQPSVPIPQRAPD